MRLVLMLLALIAAPLSALADATVFPARDGHLIVACGTDRQFRSLCLALDLPALADDPTLATNAQRVAGREALCATLSFQNWRAIRQDQGLSVEDASAVVAHMIDALVAT